MLLENCHTLDQKDIKLLRSGIAVAPLAQWRGPDGEFKELVACFIPGNGNGVDAPDLLVLYRALHLSPNGKKTSGLLRANLVDAADDYNKF
jgi:hypothetical protein